MSYLLAIVFMSIEYVNWKKLSVMQFGWNDRQHDFESVWNALYYFRKLFHFNDIVALVILSIFSSTYSCESLFLDINVIKSDPRNQLTNKCSATCTVLKVKSHKANINDLASSIQKESHQANN